MAHDVFISYASADKAVADKLCAAIEVQHIRCWMAPRDVIPGRGYGAQILQAIEASKLLVLVFSEQANTSQHVMREIERAVSKSVMILPFRIENVMPSADLEYFISTTHWLDASDPPMERHIDRLVDAVCRNIGQPAADAPPQAPVQPEIQAARQQALAESEAQQKAVAAENEAQARAKAEQEASQQRLKQEAETRRQAEATRRQAEREAKAIAQREAAAQSAKPQTPGRDTQAQITPAGGGGKADYALFLKIGIPLVLVVALVVIFKGGDKPVPKPAAAEPVAAAKGPQPFTLGNKDCDVCPEMVVIPAGSYTMGSPSNEQDRDDDEGPQRQVTIPRQFAVGKYEVTRVEFARFTSATNYRTEAERSDGCFALGQDGKWAKDSKANWRNPGYAQTDTHPVVCVSWNDVQAYLKWLNQLAPDKGFRLLTESEWEYATRGGTTTRYPWGDDGRYTEICGYANGGDTSGKNGIKGWQANRIAANCDDKHAYTAPRGSYSANRWGLHDMHGNVWEWTEDCWNANYNGAPTQGAAWTSGDCGQRVLRGGSWLNSPRGLRSAIRVRSAVDDRSDIIGFRVARTL